MDPFVPVFVDKYNEKEMESCIEYYIHKKWIQNEAGTEPHLYTGAPGGHLDSCLYITHVHGLTKKYPMQVFYPHTKIHLNKYFGVVFLH